MARSLTTTRLQSDVYAFTFDQKGLMAGLGLQGSKDQPDRPLIVPRAGARESGAAPRPR